MTPDERPGTPASPVVAAWQPPAWATGIRTDEDAVIHTRTLPDAGHDAAGTLLSVTLAQRDELDLTGMRPRMHRRAAYLVLAHTLVVDLDQATALAAAVATAERLVAEGGSPRD